MYKKGFTFIELVAVIVIVGISLMFITPKIVENYIKDDPIIDSFKKVIDDAYQLAQEDGKPVLIRGVKGTNRLYIDKMVEKSNKFYIEKEEYIIKDIDSFRTAKINDRMQPGTAFYIKIYPDGLTDTFEIELNTGKKIYSTTTSLDVKLID
jgi:prepilin-type N-terminal cleavage/methylation domain-containing protein